MGEPEESEIHRDEVGTSGGLASSVLDSLLEGCQVISRDYRYLYVNKAVTRQGHTTRGKLLGRTMMECYPGIEDTEMFSVLSKCMETRAPATMENEFSYQDGSKGWFELRFEPAPEGIVILSVDISERKQAALALKRANRALKTISRCNQTLVRSVDEQQFMADVCTIVVECGGYAAAWIRLSRAGNVTECVARAGLEDVTDHSEIPLEILVGGTSIGTLTIVATELDAIDDEERALLEQIVLDLGHGIETLRARVSHASTEEQLIAAQRLEAVGRLAGGVAHDFNNLLSVILMYTAFATEQCHESDPVRNDLKEVRAAADRAAAVTRQLLAFSRKQLMEPQVTNLNDVVGGIESMLRRLLGEDIDIEVHAGKKLGNVMADPGQVEQVIMNLALNARDAMPLGGRLTIETDNVELDREYADQHNSVEPGAYTRLSIADTGTGMSPDTCNRIFEPFFTTKERDKGTGLGLSMVYGIVKQSGGTIWVYSEPGHGTTFKLYFPRVDAPAVERQRISSATPATGTETILVVEDADAVCQASARILRSAGFRVLTAAGSGEALLVSENYRGQIDLLFTDVIMPEMSGRDLAESLEKLNPSLKVLYTSGYMDNAIVHHGVLEVGSRFIGKPFSAVDLTRKVRAVLDEEKTKRQILGAP